VKRNSIQVHCEPTRLHRADLTYRLAPPNAIDLTISVRARDHYPAYEALLASYFDLALQPQICSTNTYRDLHWFTPVLRDLYKNNDLIFPRDAETARHHLGGRWSNVRSIYQWKSQHYYAYPLALQSHPEHNIATLLMTHPKSCPSISWTVGLADAKTSSYRSDHLDDPLKARNPLYLSLFGHHLNPTVRYTAHVRLAVTDLDPAIKNGLAKYHSQGHSCFPTGICSPSFARTRHRNLTFLKTNSKASIFSLANPANHHGISFAKLTNPIGL
jgi:hypothetical protein